jgi:hypothetical protein
MKIQYALPGLLETGTISEIMPYAPCEFDQDRFNFAPSTVENFPEIGKFVTGDEREKIFLNPKPEIQTGMILDQAVDDETEDVSEDEIEDLEYTENSMPSEDELNLKRAALEESDNEGVPLNEKGFKKDFSGKDLDVPGADQDDMEEAIGEEDEENNEYSLGGDDHDEDPTDNY